MAAVIFTHTGHELHLQHDWRDESVSSADFPKYKTFFILRKKSEDISPDKPGEQVKDQREVQSNDESNSVHSLEEARRDSERTAERRTSRWLRKSRDGKDGTKDKLGEVQIAGKSTSKEESRQRNSSGAKAGLLVGTDEGAAIDTPAQPKQYRDKPQSVTGGSRMKMVEDNGSSRDESGQQIPESADAGPPVGKKGSAAIEHPVLQCSTISTTVKCCNVSTQTEYREMDKEKRTASTNTSLIKILTDGDVKVLSGVDEWTHKKSY